MKSVENGARYQIGGLVPGTRVKNIVGSTPDLVTNHYRL